MNTVQKKYLFAVTCLQLNYTNMTVCENKYDLQIFNICYSKT